MSAADNNNDFGNWNLIESEPAVFTDMIKLFGCEGIEVSEVWDVNELSKTDINIYGFIFLYGYGKDTTRAASQKINDNVLEWYTVPHIYFAQQVIQNACATQAILSILFNLQWTNESCPNIGNALTQFKSFTSSFDPETKGMSFTNATFLRTAHNSFTRTEPFAKDSESTTGESEDQFHFVAYIPTELGILELDGLKSGPIQVSDLPQDATVKSWPLHFVPVIQKRMAQFSDSEIRFSLLAVQQSKHDVLQLQMTQLESKMSNMSLSVSERSLLLLEKQTLLSLLQVEKDKFEEYRRQNIRRRHSYTPLILELLNQMAKKDMLKSALGSAQQRASSKKYVSKSIIIQKKG